MKKKIVSLDQRLDDEISGRLDTSHLALVGPHELCGTFITLVDNGQRQSPIINPRTVVADKRQQVNQSQTHERRTPCADAPLSEALPDTKFDFDNQCLPHVRPAPRRDGPDALRARAG